MDQVHNQLNTTQSKKCCLLILSSAEQMHPATAPLFKLQPSGSFAPLMIIDHPLLILEFFTILKLNVNLISLTI